MLAWTAALLLLSTLLFKLFTGHAAPFGVYIVCIVLAFLISRFFNRRNGPTKKKALKKTADGKYFIKE